MGPSVHAVCGFASGRVFTDGERDNAFSVKTEYPIAKRSTAPPGCPLNRVVCASGYMSVRQSELSELLSKKITDTSDCQTQFGARPRCYRTVEAVRFRQRGPGGIGIPCQMFHLG